MVTRSPVLTTIRGGIISTGSAFLRNVQWIPGVTCSVCAGVPGTGYSICRPCHGRQWAEGLADRQGFIAYAWPGHQSGRVMRGYKAAAPAPANQSLVANLLVYGIAAHWRCMAHSAWGTPDAWTVVPSLNGRPGDHPLMTIAGPILRAFPMVPVTAAASVTAPRGFVPTNFVVGQTQARHVLLLDDTWTTGGHVQSASAALKAAGVQRVTVLTVARWLEPSWAATSDVIGRLTSDLDPDVCPFTGAPC